MNKKLVNSYLAIVSISILIYSCDDKLSDESIYSGQDCDYRTEILSPKGFKTNMISEIDFNGSVSQFQHVNENIVYSLIGNNVGGYVELFKSLDNGVSWEDMNIDIDENPINMIFKDENLGVITISSYDGCTTPNCLNNTTILKTIDGGLNWKQIEYPNLKGNFFHPQYDLEGNLYALLSENETISLYKSFDDAESWNKLYESPELGFSLITFSFKVKDDRIYISGKEGLLIKIDKSGELIGRIQLEESVIWDLEVIDEENMVISYSNKIDKTTDGGKTWNTIYSEKGRIVGFPTQSNGYIFINKSYCQTDTGWSNDVIATTTNGGENWNEARETTSSLASRYSNSQKIEEDRWWFMIRNKLYELKSE